MGPRPAHTPSALSLSLPRGETCGGTASRYSGTRPVGNTPGGDEDGAHGLLGLYALNNHEANALPHNVRARKGGGYVRLYSRVEAAAWALVGDEGEWEARLSRRRSYFFPFPDK